MLEEFIKLTSIEANKTIYLLPSDIVALSWDGNTQTTKVTTLHGTETFIDTVCETPGEICDLCDKVLRDISQKGRSYR